MNIIWFSRHHPTRRQRLRLRELYGTDVRILKDRRPFDNAQEVVARFRRSLADEMVVVAPLSVVRQLLLLGVRPIWAEMRTCTKTHPEAEVHVGGRKPRHYRFVKFSRINGITLEVEELQPRQGGATQQRR